MKLFLSILELIVAFALIGAVLLHSAKGEGLGGIGGPARLFRSAKGMESGLNLVTGILAGSFLLLAAILGLFL